MSTPDSSSICFYRTNGNCHREATTHVFCKVEGRDTHFCAIHWQEWSMTVRGDDALAQHCPRCAPAFIARRENAANNPLISMASEPITGPLAEAIDRAMHAEGILAPTRERVLRRLAADSDAYVAAVMSRSAATIV